MRPIVARGCSGSGGVPGDVLDALVDREAALAGDAHVLVGARDRAGQAEDGVAVLQQPLGGGVQHLLGDRVADRRSDPAPRITGRATHSPIIGTCPARKIGHATYSRARRLAASRSGSSSVPER